MTITITINSVDRTSSVLVDSLRISDRLNQLVNEATFTTVGYTPEVGQELSITDGSTTIFAGVILRVQQRNVGLKVEYDVTCKDFTHYLDRKLVTERYENTTVEVIIKDIIDTYTTGFTYDGVVCTQEVDSIAFNRATVTECIERLADITGYNWYVGYDRDVHFFKFNAEPAPFSLTASGENHVWTSLSVQCDISQLRNKVFVIGGDIEGNSRAETYEADGSQLQFPLANKFARKPTVTVNAVSQTVGIDFLDDESSFDCFWSFQEKYIRFKTAPTAGHDVVVTGVPLYPLVLSLADGVSINEFGVYEFKIKDETIRSRDQAIARARIELQQHADAIDEGSFVTYTSGLQSGQLLTINANGINDQFVIQSVTLTMRTPTDGQWDVKIASVRSIGMIEFLHSLLREDEITQDEAELLINFYQLTESGTATDTVGTPTKSSPPYIYGPDSGNVGVYNFATYS